MQRHSHDKQIFDLKIMKKNLYLLYQNKLLDNSKQKLLVSDDFN